MTKDLEKTKKIDKEEIKQAMPKKKRPVKIEKEQKNIEESKTSVLMPIDESKDRTIYLIFLSVLLLLLVTWLIVYELFL